MNVAEGEDGGSLRLGTRRSPLARTQSEWVAERLRRLGHSVRLVEIVTHGDRSSAPLTDIGGTGVFASALREALRDGRIDLAVHSLKDLPVSPEEDLRVAAVPRREDPRDVLVTRSGRGLAALPAGALVGTGSPRRAAQLAVARPDVSVLPIRGNVGTRLAMVAAGDCDAIVLAAAGLARLGLSDHVSEILETAVMLPAPGQGALAVECRADRADLLQALSVLDDPATRTATTAERALLSALEAGCTAPVGALAVLDGVDRLRLDGFAGTSDGYSFVRRTLVDGATDPVSAGRRLAERMLAEGARRFGTVP